MGKRVFLTALLVLVGSAVADRLLAQDDRSRSLLQEETEDYFERWLRQDVVYIITREEKAVFEKLSTPEEKERFIEQFWHRRDPDPRSPSNEFREEHYRRLAYVNERFKSGVPGWRTDRGRTYIIHGPPNEIQSFKSGHAYDRPSHEGGGFTRTFPFEIWRYRHIEGVGPDVEIEFVDPSGSGEFRLARTPWEKDAFLFVGTAGLTVAEEFGLATRADHPYFSPATADRYPGMSRRLRDNPFTRYETFVQIQRPAEIKYKDLQQLVEVGITYDHLPFQVGQAYFQVNPQRVLVPITLEIQNKHLSFDLEESNHVARVAVYGLVTSMTHQVAAEFEDDLMVSYQPRFLEVGLQGRSVYQKIVALQSRMRYRLDLVVKDLKSGKLGVTREGIIPPEYSDRLSASSLVLADLLQPVEEASQEEMFLMGDVKVRPNLSRSFSADQPIWAYLHVYNPAVDQTNLEPSLSVTYRILHQGEKLREWTEENGESLRYYAGRRAALMKQLPAADLPPGSYRLQIQVTDRIQDQEVTSQADFQLNLAKEK